MKVQLLLVPFFCLFFWEKTHAQISLGVKGSYIHAHEKYAEGDYVEGVDLTVWNPGGVLVGEYRFARHFTAKIEAGVAQRGTKCEPYYNLPVGARDVKLVSRYCYLPVLLKYDHTFFKERLSVFVETGASYSWMYGATRYFYDENGSPTTSLKVPFDNWDDLNRRDIGIEMGGGIGFPFKLGQVQLGSRYYHGTRNVSWFKSQNRAVEYSLAVLLKIK